MRDVSRLAYSYRPCDNKPSSIYTYRMIISFILWHSVQHAFKNYTFTSNGIIPEIYSITSTSTYIRYRLSNPKKKRCVLSNKIICNVYIYINDKFNRNYVMFLWITEQLLSNDIVGPRYVLLMELSFHLTYRAHTAHVTCHWKSVQLCFAGATCPTLRPLYCAFEFAPS